MKGEKPVLALLSDDPLDEGLLRFMMEFEVFSYHPDHLHLTADQVRKAQGHGLKVLTYTVNTEDEVRK